MSKTAFKISCCKAHFYLFIFSPIDYFNRLFNSNSALRRVVDFQFSNSPSKFRLFYNPFLPPSFPALLSTNFPVSGLKSSAFRFSFVGFSIHAPNSRRSLFSSFFRRLSPPWSRLHLKLLFPFPASKARLFVSHLSASPFPLKSSAFRFSPVGFSFHTSNSRRSLFSLFHRRLSPPWSRLRLKFLFTFPLKSSAFFISHLSASPFPPQTLGAFPSLIISPPVVGLCKLISPPPPNANCLLKSSFLCFRINFPNKNRFCRLCPMS